MSIRWRGSALAKTLRGLSVATKYSLKTFHLQGLADRVGSWRLALLVHAGAQLQVVSQCINQLSAQSLAWSGYHLGMATSSLELEVHVQIVQHHGLSVLQD